MRIGAVRLQLQLQDRGAARHDLGQFLGRIELQPLHDAEAVAQRRGQQTGARGRADQRERRQIELDRARAGTLADHEIELRVLHGRVQHFLDHRTQR
jgi:hypothetical protein